MDASDRVKYVDIKIMPDRKFKTASICLMLRRPLKRGEATLNSLLASVLSSGCAKYPNLYEMNKYMEELYGAIFNGKVVKKGEFQIIRFYIEFVAGKEHGLAEAAIEFLKEVLYNPLSENACFSKDIVETEKAMLKDSISERINDKNSYARLKCVEMMCKEEPFGIYHDGYIEDLEKIDERTLFAHYKNILNSTALEFLITGDMEDEQAEISKKINEAFNMADFRPCPLSVNPIIYEPKEMVRHDEVQNINQGKICVGMRADAGFSGDKYYTLLVINEILGGSGNSKLFINLREKNSLCYNIFSFVYRAKAILMIQSGVENDNIELAIEKIYEQVDEIKKKNITDEELSLAKKSLISHFESISDYQGQMLDFYYSQYILDDNDGISDMIKSVGLVQIEDVAKMAKSLYTDVLYVLKGEENGTDN